MIRYDNGIEIFAPKEFLPSERALRQLAKIAQDPRIKKPILGLIDIHDKENNDFPTGTVVASCDYIFPQVVVSGPNCGMRMLTLPIYYNELCEENIDSLFSDLAKTIHTSSFFGDKLYDKDIINIMLKGAAWVEEKYSLSPEFKNIESEGNAFLGIDTNKEIILKAVPQSIIDLSKYRMGILGKGNHFLEMQAVEEVYDTETASTFSLKKGNICILMHSGSGGLGAVVSDFYSPRSFRAKTIKMHTFVTLEWLRSLFYKRRRKFLSEMYSYASNNNHMLFGLKENSALAELYLTATRACANFAYANRAYLAMQVKEVIWRQLKINKEAIKTLYDLSHISINREKHNEDFLWLHRVGSVLALPAEELPESNVFKKTGVPIFLPGSMGSATYICVGLKKNSCTYHSASHGAGRLAQDKISKICPNRNELVERLRKANVKLYKGNSKNIIRQDPGCFKDIDIGVEYLEKESLVKKVAKLRPIAVLKG